MRTDGFSRKQLQVIAFPQTEYDAIICDGAVRSGKTSVMSVAFFLWAMRDFENCNFAFCGKTVQTVIRNVVKPLIHMPYLKKRFSMHFSRSTNELVVSRGGVTNTFYIYGGKDESSYMLIQGVTLAGVFLDEVALMTRSFVEQAVARCSVEGSKFWFNCNPASPEHWFYKEWIQKCSEKNALHLHFNMKDNPALSDKMIARYESLYSGVFYQRYILGLWVVAEGLVYSEFSEDNITDEQPLGAEYYVSIDYGTLNPFSAGLWSVAGGKATRIKEYYYSGRETNIQKTDEEYCDEIEALTSGYTIKSVIVDPSAASFIAALRKRGYHVRKANNDVLDGIRATATMLKNGDISIHRSCTAAIREFGVYAWDEKSSVDKVIKDNDHAMDDIRYFVYTVMKHKVKKNVYHSIWAVD
jgi:PBSX family phage terminase large subunit